MKNITLVIDTELEAYITPLGTVEYAHLEDSIRNNGIREPLIAWQDVETGALTLVDGHNRYKIARTFGLDYEVKVMEFASKEEVKRFMIFDVQNSRRNLDKDGIAWAFMVGREYRQSVGKRGENLQNGKAEKSEKTTLLISTYEISLPTAKRAGKLYEAMMYVAAKNPDFPLLKICIDEGKKITQKNVSSLASVSEERLQALTDTESLYELFAELKTTGKKKPMVHNEPSEKGEEIGDVAEKELPQVVSKVSETRDMQAMRDKYKHFEKLSDKRAKTIEQQANTIERLNQKAKPMLYQLAKISQSFTVLRLLGNQIEKLDVEDNRQAWNVLEIFPSKAEAKRIFANYESQRGYFCLR